MYKSTATKKVKSSNWAKMKGQGFVNITKLYDGGGTEGGGGFNC